jgi:hypothetical protein
MKCIDGPTYHGSPLNRYSVEIVTKAGKRYVFYSRSRAGAISEAENIARVGLSGAYAVRPSQIRSVTFRVKS